MLSLTTSTRRLGLAGATVLLILVATLAGWRWATAWHPPVRAYPFQGVDVSEEDGAIEWDTVRAHGASFAYLRASYGNAGRDARFAANWAAVARAGMRRGAYHLLSLCGPAREQANVFNIVVPHTDDALPAALFLDFTPDCANRPDRAALLGEIRRFLAMAEAHTGKPMLIRVSRQFEATYHLSGAIDRAFWTVGDFFAPRYTARPWTMWQTSDLRRVEGIEGATHWDVVAP